MFYSLYLFNLIQRSMTKCSNMNVVISMQSLKNIVHEMLFYSEEYIILYCGKLPN